MVPGLSGFPRIPWCPTPSNPILGAPCLHTTESYIIDPPHNTLKPLPKPQAPSIWPTRDNLQYHPASSRVLLSPTPLSIVEQTPWGWERPKKMAREGMRKQFF